MIDPGQSTFRALADPSRREILMHLSKRDMTIAELCSHLPISRTAVRKHLTILEEGHLVSAHKAGRESQNRLEPLALKAVVEWLSYFSSFWDEKLTSLANAIEKENDNE